MKRLCSLHSIDNCGSCFSDDAKKAAGKGRYRPPALRAASAEPAAAAASGPEEETRRSLQALAVAAGPRPAPARDVVGSLATVMHVKKTSLAAFRERDPCSAGREVSGYLSDLGHAAITHVDGRELPEPVVLWAQLRNETWQTAETAARLRAASLRGATSSVFRAAGDGLLVTVFRYGPDCVSVRCGATTCFAEGELARLVLGALQGGAAVSQAAQITYLATGDRVSIRCAPGYELAVVPLYVQASRGGRAELLPLPGDLSVPLAETGQAADKLDLRGDGRGLLSPHLGYWHFLTTATGQLCSTTSGGIVTVRHMPPAGFCARFADDLALQASALRALREVESVMRAHMSVPSALWRSIASEVMAFCEERPPLLVDLAKRQQLVVLLVGLPGSGKSTACEAMTAAGLGIVRINQDKLGTRKKCLAVAEKALGAGKDVVVDRCNVSFQQRLHFLKLASKHNCTVKSIVLQAPPDLCVARVAARTDHETVPGGDEHKARTIIEGMRRELVLPVREEGIHQIAFVETTSEGWLPTVLDLVRHTA